jgi:FKBP-type peptidyl-prolyl cis-trans isomerase
MHQTFMKRFFLKWHQAAALSLLLLITACGPQGTDREKGLKNKVDLPEEPEKVFQMGQRYAIGFNLHRSVLSPAEREVVADALAVQWRGGGQLEEEAIAEFSATLDYFKKRLQQAAEGTKLPPPEERRLILAGRYIGGLGPLDLLQLSEKEEEAFWSGLAEGFTAEHSPEEYDKLRSEVKAWTGQRRAALAGEVVAANEMEAASFFDEIRLDARFRERPSGLFIRHETNGNGRQPGPQDRVVIHYRGKLLDGREFDSSYKRGESAEFGLDQVIPGFTEGLTLMQEGGKATIVMPSHLAYGMNAPRGSIITPGAALIFEIQLLEVLPAR